MAVPATERQAAVEAILVPGTTYYLQACSGDPGLTGENQIAALGRVAATYTGADGTSDNVGEIEFANVQTEITHVAVFTAAAGGTFKMGGVLNYSAGVFQQGETVTIPAGSFDFSIPAA